MAKNVVINGVTYQDVPKVQIPQTGGGTAEFYDTSAGTAVAGDVRNGKKFFGAAGESTGTLAEIADRTTTISERDQSVTIAAGIHAGGGKVELSSDAKAALVSGNIRAGATVMGVSGDAMVQNTTVGSGAAGSAQIAKGYKAWVNGALVDGGLTAATVSQNSSTKVLSIS